MPVIVRARDEADIEPLTAAGASEVVPEAFESGLMLASHTLVWVGVPLSRVMRRVSQVRGERYGLLRGLFQGATATTAKATPRRRACMRSRSSPAPRALGRRLDELGLDALGVEVRAVRRRGAKAKLDARRGGRAAGGRRGGAARRARGARRSRRAPARLAR